MHKLRVRKIMLFISVITVLFLVYQLSYSEPTNRHSRESLLMKDDDRSFELKKQLKVEERLSNDIKEETGKTSNVQSLSPEKFIDASAKDHYSMKSKGLPPLFDGEKIVHVDLKGAPPKVSYYKEFFPLIKSFGATGILMEYEDMFPYRNSDIPAGNAYSRSDIKSILKIAMENGLEVIPLVQTFGHLEFILKLKEFQNLREVMKYPQVICPTQNGTVRLLRSMIDDIIQLHPTSRYIHIGCDEVYNLGECSLCVDTMLKNNWTKQQLFLSHVTMIASYIKNMYPTVRTLMWDDEFRKMSPQELLASNLGSLVEPVIWKYTTAIDTYLPEEIWNKYAAVFESVWIASAFKGATGPDMYITDINYHLENHRAWMKLVATYRNRINFKGIVMTGWQRYDHFAILCELLPVGLPSLVVNLAFLSQDDIDMQKVPPIVHDALKCGPGLLHPKLGAHCSFPGSVVYEKAHQLDQLLDQIKQMLDNSEMKGWLSEYNIRTDFASPAHVEGATTDLDRNKMELTYLEQDMRKALGEVFDKHTVREWIYTFISPVHRRIVKLWGTKERLQKPKVWHRRPFDIEL